MSFRRRRFAEVIARQLELFERENADLMRRCDQALRAYGEADREDAEGRYSEYLDLAELALDELGGMRDQFAASLDETTAEEYEQAFDRAVRKRFALLRAAG